MVTQARPIDAKYVTIGEFEQMSEFNGPYELINGVIVKKMAGDNHDRIARKIDRAIEKLDPDDNLGRTWRTGTFKLASGTDDARDNGRMPDLAYIIADRVPPLSDESMTVAPDLVVEVWSPGDVNALVNLRSTRNKMEYWPEHGVKITWCVNPAAKEVEVLYSDNSKPAMIYEIGDTLDGEDVIPGFKMAVADLFV